MRRSGANSIHIIIIIHNQGATCFLYSERIDRHEFKNPQAAHVGADQHDQNQQQQSLCGMLLVSKVVWMDCPC